MAETAALIVAAGLGERAPGDIPKQFRPLGGKPLLRWTIEAFRSHPRISSIQVIIAAKDRERYEAAAAGLALPPPASGGSTRTESVRLGLEALAKSPPAHVLIHDGARPFVSAALIERVVSALDQAEAVAPLLPVADTIRQRTEIGYEILPRDALVRAQTPQGFHFAKIREAHRRFAGQSVTDDIALAERANLRIAAVTGEGINIKLTTPDDFALAEKFALGSLLDVRTGSGFDAHRFGPGDHVWLCGVRIPYEAALV